MVNEINIDVKCIDGNNSILLDNILFRNCVYVDVFIDGHNVRGNPDFSDMLVVYSELKKSVVNSGSFLIFTCACGVADDGGWKYVNVMHSDNYITWSFFTNNEYKYIFDRETYIYHIKNIERKLNKFKKHILIPQFIVYPE